MPSFNLPINTSKHEYFPFVHQSIYTGKSAQSSKGFISYEFKLESDQVQDLLQRLEQKKTTGYFTMMGALCLLIFSNLVLGQPSASLISRSVNVLTSIGSIAISLAGAYFHNRHQGTIDKIKLLFGTKEQQKKQLIVLAKRLPDDVVSKTFKRIPLPKKDFKTAFLEN